MLKRVSKLNKLLPFVAIGTIADCQSIVDKTNRAITKVGLKLFNNPDNIGLYELLNQLGYIQKIEAGYKFNSQDIAFQISPILNSSGRITHAKHSILCLLKGRKTKSRLFAFENETEKMPLPDLVKTLIDTNNVRKNMVAEIIEEVHENTAKQIEKEKKLIIISGNWNKGIIGLIASKIVTLTNRPTMVLAKHDLADELTQNEFDELEIFLKSL
jgi:single-stranded-DNA-specific exonuclease